MLEGLLWGVESDVERTSLLGRTTQGAGSADGMSEDEGDDCFHDEWWESLAIDQLMDSQLLAVEQEAVEQQQLQQQGLEAQAAWTPSVHDKSHENQEVDEVTNTSLRAQLDELRVLYDKQAELVRQLRQEAQQKQGEVAVVRANLNRTQQQHVGLQQNQNRMEQEYRERIESLQQENRRQLERMETAAAFRRIEQDSSRSAWPSTARRRAPILFDTSKPTPGPSTQDPLLSTPTRSRRVQVKHMPPTTSPLSLTRRKRPIPYVNEEPSSPSKSRSVNAAIMTPRAFPRFENTFLPPHPTTNEPVAASSSVVSERVPRNVPVSAVPLIRPALPQITPVTVRPGSPTTSIPARSPSPSSSTPTPSPEADRLLESQDGNDAPDTRDHILTAIFTLQTRWITHVLCHPCRASCIYPIITSEPGAPSDSASQQQSKLQRPLQTFPSLPHRQSESMLLYILTEELPTQTLPGVRTRYRRAADLLWQSVLRGSSYAAFFSEWEPVVRQAMRACQGADPSRQLHSIVQQVWSELSHHLYEAVAVAIRIITGIFLHLSMTESICRMLAWMASLGIAHTAFVPHITKRVGGLPWVTAMQVLNVTTSQYCDATTPPAASSSQTAQVPVTPKHVRSDASTPTSMMQIMIECVRKASTRTDLSSLNASVMRTCSSAHVSGNAGPLSTPQQARHMVLLSVLRLCKVIAWTVAPQGFQDLHPFLQSPGVVLALLDTPASESSVLIHTLQLCVMTVSDPLTLHICLSAQFDTTWQAGIPPRLSQARFPVLDVLAKHLVDRRGDCAPQTAHEIHMSILYFLTQAARWPDTSIMLAECVPLLPALIQCLSWDVALVWNTEPVPASPAATYAETYVSIS